MIRIDEEPTSLRERDNSSVLEAIVVNSADSQWRKIYRIGGIAALVVILVALIDIILMFIPGTGNVPGTRAVVDWFKLFQENWFLAGRDLGMFNLVTTLCTVLVFFAIVGVHRRINPVFAILALILICIGATIYIANNMVLPMLTLSRQYTLATTDAQKLLISAAGQTLLAQEDISAGSFMGFFIPEVACILMSTVMLKGKVFNPLTAWAGILAESILLIFNIIAAFLPDLSESVMPLGGFGGMLSIIWLTLIAFRLFRLERGISNNS